MRGIDGLHGLRFSPECGADNFAEAIAAIAHGQQAERVRRSRRAPSARHRVGGRMGGEGALELVGSDENAQRHEVI